MVRDVFRLAKENAPAIIFIDEIDAIATARFDAQTGADREVQRILMELLNQVLITFCLRSKCLSYLLSCLFLLYCFRPKWDSFSSSSFSFIFDIE